MRQLSFDVQSSMLDVRCSAPRSGRAIPSVQRLPHARPIGRWTLDVDDASRRYPSKFADR
jgi:hypothetical protein